MDWLEKHGEQFLSRSVGVGRNLQKALASQKSQTNFEKVVQVKPIFVVASQIPLLLIYCTEYVHQHGETACSGGRAGAYWRMC